MYDFRQLLFSGFFRRGLSGRFLGNGLFRSRFDRGAVLQKGADTLNTQMGIPASLSDVITGVLLFFMLGCEFFINYKLVFRGAEERHKRKEAAK